MPDLDEHLADVILAFADRVAMALLHRPRETRDAYLEAARRTALKSAMAAGFDATEATFLADTLDKLIRTLARHVEIGHDVAGHA